MVTLFTPIYLFPLNLIYSSAYDLQRCFIIRIEIFFHYTSFEFGTCQCSGLQLDFAKYCIRNIMSWTNIFCNYYLCLVACSMFICYADGKSYMPEPDPHPDHLNNNINQESPSQNSISSQEHDPTQARLISKYQYLLDKYFFKIKYSSFSFIK